MPVKHITSFNISICYFLSRIVEKAHGKRPVRTLCGLLRAGQAVMRQSPLADAVRTDAGVLSTGKVRCGGFGRRADECGRVVNVQDAPCEAARANAGTPRPPCRCVNLSGPASGGAIAARTLPCAPEGGRKAGDAAVPGKGTASEAAPPCGPQPPVKGARPPRPALLKKGFESIREADARARLVPLPGLQTWRSWARPHRPADRRGGVPPSAACPCAPARRVVRRRRGQGGKDGRRTSGTQA